jgi:hypothetical protein
MKQHDKMDEDFLEAEEAPDPGEHGPEPTQTHPTPTTQTMKEKRIV